MGQRDDRHQHANRRRKLDPRQSTQARQHDDGQDRAPLAGYESVYEISRRGQVYSRRTRAPVPGGYERSAFVRIAVKGAIVTLQREKAVADSFARLGIAPG
jgi:hypothetical protein